MFSLILAVGFAVDAHVSGYSCSSGQCSTASSRTVEKKIEVKRTSRNLRTKGRFKRCS